MKEKPEQQKLKFNPLYGAVGFLFVMVVALNFGYPITLSIGPLGIILFLTGYALMFVIGVLVTSDDRNSLIRTSFAALAWMVASVLATIFPGNVFLSVLQFMAFIPCLLLIIGALFGFIFNAQMVDGRVLITAITIYILLGSLFTPLYGMIEFLSPHSFIDNGLGQPVQWQQLIYYSMITLTTVGYGDIIPVNAWARTLAALEGMTGVLYIAVLMGRLVGIYRQEK
ncbi:MAG: potassium channel family protein [Anaerolineae bacterium]